MKQNVSQFVKKTQSSQIHLMIDGHSKCHEPKWLPNVNPERKKGTTDAADMEDTSAGRTSEKNKNGYFPKAGIWVMMLHSMEEALGISGVCVCVLA